MYISSLKWVYSQKSRPLKVCLLYSRLYLIGFQSFNFCSASEWILNYMTSTHKALNLVLIRTKSSRMNQFRTAENIIRRIGQTCVLCDWIISPKDECLLYEVMLAVSSRASGHTSIARDCMGEWRNIGWFYMIFVWACYFTTWGNKFIQIGGTLISPTDWNYFYCHIWSTWNLSCILWLTWLCVYNFIQNWNKLEVL